LRFIATLILAALGAAAISAPAAHVSNVSFADGTLKIQLTAPSRFTTTRWSSARRFCVDVDASGIDLQLRQLSVYSGKLRTVRWSQWKPESVRVVLDLTSRDMPTVISSQPTDVIEVRLEPSAVRTAVAPALTSAASIDQQTPTPPEARAQIGDIVVDQDDEGRPSRVTVHTSAPVAVRDTWSGNHLTLELPDAAESPERILPVNDPVVLRVRTGGDRGHAVFVLDAAQRFTYKLQQLEDGKGFSLDLLLSTPAEPTPPPAESPLTGDGLRGKLVVLDPGHGGKDNGTHSQWVVEKEANLDIARRLKAVLESSGARVVMTRSDDTFIPLPDRPALAMKLNANAFVSIHCNYAASMAGGTEAFYRRNDGESRRLATCLYDAHRAQTGLGGRRVKPDSGAPDGGLAVLKHNATPCALIEIAFVNNPTEGRKLADASWRQSVAEGLGKGLERFMEGRD
jgi:N-acetylmuramoyl-L-alanine amidase